MRAGWSGIWQTRPSASAGGVIGSTSPALPRPWPMSLISKSPTPGGIGITWLRPSMPTCRWLDSWPSRWPVTCCRRGRVWGFPMPHPSGRPGGSWGLPPIPLSMSVRMRPIDWPGRSMWRGGASSGCRSRVLGVTTTSLIPFLLGIFMPCRAWPETHDALRGSSMPMRGL